MIRVTTAAVLALAGTALAQYEITIEVENPTLLPGESTTVTLFAGYELPDYAVAFVTTDLITSVGSEGWSEAAGVPPMDGPGSMAGVPSATGFDGILAGQLQFLGAAIAADPTNPIPFWNATYTAPRDVSVSFDVMLSTMTVRYDVYPEIYIAYSESRLADLTEGSATIRVIPAPASASLLALGVLAAACRRR